MRPGEAFPPVEGLLPACGFSSTGWRRRSVAQVPPEAGRAVVDVADRLLAGDWEVLGTARPDVVDPDWFRDPVTGRRAPDAALAFRIDHRDEAVTGNVKSVWELSRHHHLTVLAAAWWLTSDPRYAEVVAAQLRSWWRANPFLSGIHWTSGIELGVRLTSWVWIRRLLDDWPGVAGLFEENPEALAQIRWHQEHLAAFRSRGSSANNHVIAEAVGRLAAACAFPWYGESEAWRRSASRELEQELRANTFPSGVNRELATDYHRFVAELGLVALVEARAAGHPLGEATRDLLVRSLDAAAAILDVRGHPPRQGDGDEGRALVLDEPGADPWSVLLACGASTVGGAAWWPPVRPGVLSTLLGAVGRSDAPTGRTSPEPRDVSRRRPLHPAYPPRPGTRDLVPLRRRAPRLPLHRGTRATPTPWPSRSGTRAWSFSWIRARTATTGSRSGGATSDRPGPTTPSRSTARTRPSRGARSCGPPTPTGLSTGRS